MRVAGYFTASDAASETLFCCAGVGFISVIGAVVGGCGVSIPPAARSR